MFWSQLGRRGYSYRAFGLLRSTLQNPVRRRSEHLSGRSKELHRKETERHFIPEKRLEHAGRGGNQTGKLNLGTGLWISEGNK